MQHILIYSICTCVRSTLQKENNAINVTDVNNNSSVVQGILNFHQQRSFDLNRFQSYGH
jgi:hypothetical protein